MNNTLKRVCAVVLSFSFLSMQSTLAEVLTTGQFAGNNVLNNVNGGAVISGHTSGLSGVNTDGTTARLDFNNNTRIDWSTLNVGNGQALNFNNGNYAVLNNVLNGMSTFAGKVSGNVWGGNGTVIISNPNGMLLNGGQFETSGSIILTTKNLLGLGVNDLKDDSTINNAINNAGYNPGEYKIISIGKNGTTASTLTSNNNSINIISKGINIDGANLTANGTNGIALTTSDGQNFVAALNNNNGVAGNVNFGTNSIQIANSSIKSNNGDLKLISVGGGDITATTNNTIVAPNITVNSGGSANLKNLTGYSSITANATKNLNVSGTTTNTTNLTAGNDLTADGITSHASITAGAGHNLSLTNSTTNTTSLTSSNDINASGLTSYSSINATSTNGNVNLSGVNSTNSTTLSAGNNVSIKGNLTSYSTVNATAGNIIDESDTTATITSNQMNLTAGNTVNLTKNYVDYCNVVANAKNIGVNVIGDYTYGSGFGSNTTLNATEGLSINATGNLTVNNQNIAYKTLNLSGSSVGVESSTLSGNLIINTAGNIIAKNNKINGYFDATSTNGTIEIRNNNGYITGDTTLLAKGGIDVISTLIKNGNLKATSTNDKVSVQSVTVNGDITTSSKNYTTFSNVRTNNLTANSDKNISLVYFNNPTSIICNGNVNLTAATNIQMDNTYTSGNLIAKAAQDIITHGGSVSGTTSYNVNNITSNGTVYNGNIALNSIGNATISSSEDLNFTTPTVGGNLSATTSGNVNLTNGTISGTTGLNAANATSAGTNYTGSVGLNLAQDANFNSTSDLNFVTPKINGKLTATTTTNINVTNGGSISGDTTLTAGKKTNVNVGSTDALSLSNLTVTNSSNHSDGNINVNNIASSGNVNISGSSDVRSDIYVTNSTINGSLTTTKGWGSNVDNTTIGNGLNISGNSYNTSVTNSNITGETNIATANRKITLSNDNLTGNLNINKPGTVPNDKGSDIFISGDTVSGNVTTNSGDWTIIQGLNANNIDATANGSLNTSWMNAGSVNLTSKNANASIHQVNAQDVNMTANNGTASYSWSTISGDTTSTAKNITMTHSTINGNTDLNATNDITINSDMNYNTITANAGDNISLARNGDYTFNNDGKIVLNATNQLNISATKSLTVNNGVFNALTTNLTGTNVTVNSTAVTGNLIATTAGNLITNNGSVSNNTTYTANNITSKGTNYNGNITIAKANNVDFTSGNNLNFTNSKIDGTLNATSTNGAISIRNNNGYINEDTTLNAKGGIDVISTLIKNGDLTATSTNDKVAIQSVTLNNGNIKTNSADYTTFRGVKANNLEAVSKKDINFYTTSTFNNVDLNTATNILVDKAVSYNDLKATANNITLNRSGDFLLGVKEDLTASNNLNVNIANGGLSVDNKTLNSSNINLVADKINSNNSTYNGNTAMTAANTIDFTGTNNFNGTLNATSTNAGNIGINGDKTFAKDNLNITTNGNVNLNNVSVTGDSAKLAINNAYDINVNNTTTGKLSILNPNDSLFNTAQILNTQALTTEFANGNSLIVDLTASTIFGNNRSNIKNSASNVNELLIYPIETPAASGTQSELIEEATKTINSYKASGINTVTAQGFTPIAFAANDNANSSLTKTIGNVIYRDTAGLVHITERLNLND